MKDKSLIPVGLYCYEITDVLNGGVRIKTQPCPYWELLDNLPEQANGYCHYLDHSDADSESLSLLWDGVKECGVNLD